MGGEGGQDLVDATLQMNDAPSANQQGRSRPETTAAVRPRRVDWSGCGPLQPASSRGSRLRSRRPRRRRGGPSRGYARARTRPWSRDLRRRERWKCSHRDPLGERPRKGDSNRVTYGRAIWLSDSTPWLTALANDEGYERAFVGQLENFAKPDDVFIVISASGNSPNLVTAVEFARTRWGSRRWVCWDSTGASCSTWSSLPVFVKSDIGLYGLVETMHSLIADVVTSCLLEDQAPRCADERRVVRTQAVIVRRRTGNAARPITDHRPKPMVSSTGRPFLEYLVDQLASRGSNDCSCSSATSRTSSSTTSVTGAASGSTSPTTSRIPKTSPRYRFRHGRSR